MAEAADLLERERELVAIGRLLDGARAGAGGTLVIAGEAGIGKSALLAAAAARARDCTVPAARGGELEHEFAFGVARQLFEPVAEAGLRARGDPASIGFDVIHGLFWLAASIAEQRPLVLSVDDAQWADTDSLRLLDYLARRVGELPIALLIAVREGEGDPLTALRAEAAEIAPAALGEGAAAALVTGALGPPAPTFTAACRAVTGGNPFLLRALLDELAAERVPPSADEVERVRATTPASVQRSVLVRLGRLGPAAVGLAQAVAVLEPADLADAAALAGLGAEATAAADALAAAHVLEPAHPLRFVHPLLRAAVYGDMGLARRADGHRRAAQLLDARAPDRAVGHLLTAHPAGDPWVLERLTAGAERALAGGSAATARALLERAVGETRGGDERARVLARLGRVERLAGVAGAPARLEQALELTDDDELRAELVRELFDARLRAGDRAGARALLERARRELPDPTGASWLELEATRVSFMQMTTSPEAVAELGTRLAGAEDMPGDTRAERRLLALLAFHRLIWTQGTGAAAGRLAERALAGGRLIEEEGISHLTVVAALSVLQGVERDDQVAAHLLDAESGARARGSAVELSVMLALRARLALFRGELREAEADARASLEPAEAAALRAIAELTLSTLLMALVERGELDEADALLRAREFPDQPSGSRHLLLQARAALRRAQGRRDDAIADLGVADAQRSGTAGGSIFTRARLAELRHDRTAAADAVTRGRRWRVAGPLGIALRAQGLADGDLGLLEQAVAELARSPRRLEHARTLVELGAARRRANQRAAAREPLAAGMELAHRCGAAALAERARGELVACGARPRRLVRTGVDALTASELRVAQLAAAGSTNREIAQALFVTRRTVETHLTAIYRKLDIAERGGLQAALAKDHGPPHDANRLAVARGSAS